MHFITIKKSQQTTVFHNVIGHSLGEYNALLAANVFDFATGLNLVKKRSELMAAAQNGTMAAVIGLSINAISDVLMTNDLTDIAIANHNSDTQIVLSGSLAKIQQARLIFKKINSAMFIPLNVSGAFHSPLMLEAQQKFEIYLSSFSFQSPTIPVIANVSAKKYALNNTHALLAQQITHTVCWKESIDYLIMQGETQFEEIGSNNILTKIFQSIIKEYA